jgi:hypothetical protein
MAPSTMSPTSLNEVIEAVIGYVTEHDLLPDQSDERPAARSAAEKARHAPHRESIHAGAGGDRAFRDLDLEAFVLEKLMPHLRQRFPTNCDLDLMAVALPCYLGPRDEWRARREPPGVLCDELLEVFRIYLSQEAVEPACARLADAELRTAVQIALAYGGKWRRSKVTGADRNPEWNHVWPGTTQELTTTTREIVIGCFKILNAKVRGFHRKTSALAPQENEELEGISLDLTQEFVYGIDLWNTPEDGPDDGREVQESGKIRFPLQSWDPGRGSLYTWLQMHVFGMPLSEAKKRLEAGKVGGGRLYPRLVDLKVDDVAFQWYPQRGETEADAAEYCGEDNGKPGGGMACIAPKKLPIVPGEYIPKKTFWTCNSCGYYVESRRRAKPEWIAPNQSGQGDLVDVRERLKRLMSDCEDPERDVLILILNGEDDVHIAEATGEKAGRIRQLRKKLKKEFPHGAARLLPPDSCPCGASEFAQRPTAISVRREYADPMDRGDQFDPERTDAPT